jgi:hypothetical protein
MPLKQLGEKKEKDPEFKHEEIKKELHSYKMAL